MTASPSKKLRVYLVEDDVELREETLFSLTTLGFDAHGFGNATDFYKAQATRPCDVAVIDVGLPGEDGFAIAAHLRNGSQVGIVMLTARGTLQDKLHGLQQGADAYLVKPVHMLELTAVLHSVTRRITAAVDATPTPSDEPSGWQLLDGGWILSDPHGQTIPLTTSERAFMQCLFERMDTPVSRDRLIIAMGGDAYDFDPHRIDSLASRLRRKAANAGIALTLRAVRGAGYIFHDIVTPKRPEI
ncbi:response regulator transcription factor [Variovorax sp. VNK109]|jgi:two-component system response regulator PhoP|uniref:response regulator transcription factor n=1 Tax=Variovorax sp. VNK109 TaxID=3400919 RepID=UPI003C10834F